jgi:hypothetical protein
MTCEIAQDIWDDATERGQSALEAALLARTLTAHPSLWSSEDVFICSLYP